jgi:hypothetical protein
MGKLEDIPEYFCATAIQVIPLKGLYYFQKRFTIKPLNRAKSSVIAI